MILALIGLVVLLVVLVVFLEPDIIPAPPLIMAILISVNMTAILAVGASLIVDVAS